MCAQVLCARQSEFLQHDNIRTAAFEVVRNALLTSRAKPHVVGHETEFAPESAVSMQAVRHSGRPTRRQ